ncbi:hypothetical protein V5799_027988 [Amblyomma americanum]|uniref:Uncharacterized protein n=1 Tax=Amblyomma americanum TaxID=6943 RepID=A0AAQ4DE55_AMBAM
MGFYHVAGVTGGACLSSERGHLNICNRSPNRFGSLADCRKFCEGPERPQKRCDRPASFSTCARTDLKRDWWFHDGVSCRQWEFPSGTCPAANSEAYASFQECFNRCSHPTDHRWQCREPHPTACDADELRHPYFATSAGGGKFTCLEASPDNLRGHICLTGENNFNSPEACEAACLREPSA